jgi:HD-GYP domain-containing protein (c-di-GMP phosphodiesterase class II)
MSAHEITPETQRLLADTRVRVRNGLVRREILAEGFFGVAFLVSAYLLATQAPTGQFLSLMVIWALIATFAVFVATHFATGEGYAHPTQIVFVPIVLLSPALAPLVTMLGLALYQAFRSLRGDLAPSRVWTSVADAWFAVGPALVLVLAGATNGPQWAHLPLYVAALAAQFAFDIAGSIGRAWACGGARAGEILREFRQIHLVDALLAPIGLVVAFGVADHPAAIVLVLPLAGLLRLFSREREARVDQTLELSSAYRGTALLLGDVIGEDDEYTGEHTQGVVELSLRVGDELGVDEETRRAVEFGALLHDVGKIAIPKSIINKPGKLDDHEWAVMKTHTIEGQRMLERVGGLLGRIGVVVRASHERWDGGGYPDGLAAEAIPLAARIVAACDAWNAMQTDRSYRKALPFEVAIEELHRNAGTQFDPRVVSALVAVVERDA